MMKKRAYILLALLALLLLSGCAPQSFTAGCMYNSEGEKITDTRHAMMEIHMHLPVCAPRWSILRRRR